MKKFLIPLFLILVIIVGGYAYASEIKNLLTNGIESEEITINSGEAIVFSFSKQIEEITFSKDSGFTIRTLEGGKWIDLSNSVSDYVPLKGYLVRNISTGNLVINARYKTVSTIEDSIFQKSLKAGWNLVGIAYKDDNDGFVSVSNGLGESLPYSQVLDFTGNGFKNNLSGTYSNEVQILNKSHNVNNSLYQIKAKSDLANYNLLEKFAYAIFINTDSEIAGSQKLTSTGSSDDDLGDLLDDLIGGGDDNDDDDNTNVGSAEEIEAAHLLASKGIILEHDNANDYLLNNYLLRQEMATIIRGVANLEKTTICNNIFTDVSSTLPNTWACYSIEALYNANIIELNQLFRPTENITKVEALQMIVKATFNEEYIYNSNSSDSWKKQVVDFAVSKGIVSNFSNYDTYVTRGFVYVASVNAMDIEEDDDDLGDLLDDLIGDSNSDAIINNTSFGDVNKTLGSQDIEVLPFQITSSGSDEINIKKIKLKFMVSGNNATSQDISEIKLVDVNNNTISSVSGNLIDINGNVEIVLNNNEIKILGNVTKNYKVLVSITNNTTLINKQIITQFTSIEAIGTDFDSVDYSINNQVGIIINVIEKGILSLTEDQNNNFDNRYEKNILAGDSINVFSVDAQATNENINVGNVTFTVNKDLRKAVTNASLYKGVELISTNINTDITSSTISFNNLENLIISNEEVELILKLNTANIGFEKVGETIIDAKVTNVSLTDNEGITTNQTVDDVNINVDGTLFSIIPATIITNVNQNLSSGLAKIQFYNNTGNNSIDTGNITPEILLTNLIFSESGNNTNGYFIYKEGVSQRKGTISNNGTFDKGDMTVEDLTIGEWGYYIIEPVNNSGIYSLELNNIIYNINGINNSTGINSKLINNLDIGTISY